MTKKEARGTKRTCQNSDCGSRFYDLNRRPIICPICQSQYMIATAASTGVPVEDVKPKKQPEFADAEGGAPEEAAETDETVALAEIEGAEEPVAAEEDETFLEEEEEDGGDVSGIIGGGVDSGDEEP